MINTKLFQTLQQLSPKQKSDYMLFLESPYFNKNKEMIQLAAQLIDLTKRKKPKLSKKEVWQMLKGQEAYNDVRMRKYISDLLKLTEKFLAIQVFDNEPLIQNIFLLEAVTQMQLEPLYNTSIKSARKKSQERSTKGAEYYFYQYKIEKYYNDILEREGRKQKLNLEMIISNLDKFYMGEKMINYSSVLSHRYVFDHDYDILFIEEIISHLEKYKQSNTPVLNMYYLTAQLYLKSDEQTYQELIELLPDNIEIVPHYEARDIINALINFCIRQGNAGRRSYLRELFNLYSIALEREFLMTNGELTPWTFMNIVLVALRLEEFSWVENFIHDYQNFIHEAHRENAVLFNQARLAFYKKDHDNVLKLLRTVEFEDISYNVNSKMMLMGSYYEMEEIEVLLKFIDSFKTFVRRNTSNIPVKRKNNYLAFCKHLTKLVRYRTEKDQLLKLKDDINKDSNLGDRKWLISKIDEILTPRTAKA